MKKLIDEVENCLNNNLYVAALTLALTIPDICGQVEAEKRELKSEVGIRYKKWFKENVSHYYLNEKGLTSDGKEARDPYLSPEIIYQLRCSVLHSGHVEIKKGSHPKDFTKFFQDKILKYKITFFVTENKYTESFGGTTDNQNKDAEYHVLLDLLKLCKNICKAAKKYYDENDVKSFEKNEICFIE